jgi:Bcl-2 homology region 4
MAGPGPGTQEIVADYSSYRIQQKTMIFATEWMQMSQNRQLALLAVFSCRLPASFYCGL